MSWRDTIKSQSSGGAPLVGAFRGAKFIVPDSEGTFGRRVQLHEYPMRDIPWVEDLGRSARHFACEVFVDDSLPGGYLAARDALIVALEAEGGGTLVHPWYGTMQVALAEPAAVRESTRDGGRANFRLSFIEAGSLRFPTSAADTAQAVDKKAGTPSTPTTDGTGTVSGTGEGALGTAMDRFAAVFDVSHLPDWGVTDLANDVYQTLSLVEDRVSGTAGTVAGLIRTPGNMAAAIVGSMQRLREIAGEPIRAIGLYKPLFSAGSDVAATPATTNVRKQQAASSAALHRLVQQTAVIEACRSAGQLDFPEPGTTSSGATQTFFQTRAEVLALASELQDALDAQMEVVDPVTGAPIDDSLFQALDALRAAMVTDLRTRGARLPELTTYTPRGSMPALVIAYRLYGDATRDEEIVLRNHISRPGFVPGGRELEVLNA